MLLLDERMLSGLANKARLQCHSILRDVELGLDEGERGVWQVEVISTSGQRVIQAIHTEGLQW